MASLFEGGPREAVLRAVAEVCGGAGSSRFKLLEGDLGYTAVASPISSDENRIGVVILLREEPASGRRISKCAKELQPPLDELTRCLGKLSGRRGHHAHDQRGQDDPAHRQGASHDRALTHRKFRR